ncbi:hypothetical protein GHT06_008444 [Daphnia sinensis]|uniref:Laminin G domain-containing protein n=1 Tax=Daphnia sinensis TaxID=1820382 RepID=A0AAD5Q0N8_9CRUS|nr:hypothetical protein GHT06_008444 [Daphnia sinensis]
MDEVRLLVCSAFKKLFKDDKKGEISLHAVRQVNHLVKNKRHHQIPPDCLDILIALRIKDVNLDKEREEEINRYKTLTRKEKLLILSKTERRRRKKIERLEKEIVVARAEHSKGSKSKYRTETVKLVFTIYFRILKMDPKSGLMGVVLQGLAKFAHTINVDFFTDLVEVFNKVIANDQLVYRQCLYAIQKVTEYVGAKEENVDIFTVMSSSPSRYHSVDVRYSAHGSPYYDPDKLNGLTATHQDELERLLDAEVLMFGIDECLYEKNSICSEGSCTNRLQITEQPYRVTTNTSTFVGVDARIVPECVCLADEYLSSSSCSATSCLNGGTCTGDAAQPFRCIDGFQGPRCKGLDVSFGGTGWAWYDPLPTCASGYLSLTVIAQTGNGLILYSGPTAVPPDTTVSDFLAVELREGSPVLYLDLGSGTKRLELPDRSRNLVDGKAHDLEISWNQRSVQMRLGQCSDGQPYCSASSSLVGSNEYLNVNGPLQVGGITADLQKLQLALNWGSIPTDIGFSGCLQNLTFNGLTYNLYDPGFFKTPRLLAPVSSCPSRRVVLAGN